MSKDLQKIQRNFIIGDEWLYFKIYTGYKTSETILKEAIMPLVEYLLKKQIIDKWFFIRFTDPKYHLRIRFHLTDKSKIAEIILNFNNTFKQYVEDDLIWKVQTDTYKREIERYGTNSIEFSEELFFIDSMACVNLIKELQGNETENTRWLISLKMIDVLLNDFEYNLQQKNNLLKVMQESFGKEVGLTKDSRKQLGTKYRTHKNEIESILNGAILKEFDYLLIQKTSKLKPIIDRILKLKENNTLDAELSNLVSSYIHMMLNRIFRTNQRKYELVVYDFLFRYYYSQITRQSKPVLESKLEMQF